MPKHKQSRDMRGFASMDENLQHHIACKGGANVPAEKRSFHQDRKLARKAGRVGGRSVAPENRAFARDPALAVEAGRLGGLAGQRRRLL